MILQSLLCKSKAKLVYHNIDFRGQAASVLVRALTDVLDQNVLDQLVLLLQLCLEDKSITAQAFSEN